jgi:hypothetical protein
LFRFIFNVKSFELGEGMEGETKESVERTGRYTRRAFRRDWGGK